MARVPDMPPFVRNEHTNMLRLFPQLGLPAPSYPAAALDYRLITAGLRASIRPLNSVELQWAGSGRPATGAEENNISLQNTAMLCY